MILAWVLALDIHGAVIGVRGPYNWTLRQCNAQVELWTKMMLAPPLPANFDRRIHTYQCVIKGARHA